MNSQKFLIGTIVGGLVNFFVGYLLNGVLFANYMTNNSSNIAGLAKEPPEFLFIFIACILQAAIVAYVFLKWTTIRNFKDGAMAGLVIGLLYGFSVNLLNYGLVNIQNIQATIVSSLLWAVEFVVSGGVIGWLYGRNK